MAHQYAKIAFTDTVRQVQTEQNSRAGYASMDTGEDYNFVLSNTERDFINQRDSFYMASVSETDWPYVQHRGGPAGFLKVIDENTLGFADYKGNRQYVSTGNFRTNDKVSLILMDYANRRRLKIIGHISQVDEADWTTLASLEDDHYRARVERGFIIKIAAFDWNCPQHITPRYSEAEISTLIEPLEEKIKQLEAQKVVTPHTEKNIQPDILGDGELPLVITGIRQLTSTIRAYELRSISGEALPKVAAGSHIQVPVILADDRLAWRSYSISSNPNRTDCYEIAVKREDNGNGGSKTLHQHYQLGLKLHCKIPENFFELVDETNSHHAMLIAAGIGITPIKSMALALLKQQKSFELHYAGSAEHEMAYSDRLTRQLGDKLQLYPSQAGIKLSLKQLMSSHIQEKKSQLNDQGEIDTHFYFCGPAAMLSELKQCAAELNIPMDRVHYEQFSAQVAESEKACQLTLSQSNVQIDVASDESLLDAVLSAGIEVPYSCQSGECKSCVVNVSTEAVIEHLDNCLTEQERASGKMCLCVSRPIEKTLTIAL
jgi:ferredoxin-NADP reductase/predicted pyridoxine 5'-phosphate oxidase superfamily flavin-nucleotide-binding protein